MLRKNKEPDPSVQFRKCPAKRGPLLGEIASRGDRARNSPTAAKGAAWPSGPKAFLSQVAYADYEIHFGRLGFEEFLETPWPDIVKWKLEIAQQLDHERMNFRCRFNTSAESTKAALPEAIEQGSRHDAADRAAFAHKQNVHRSTVHNFSDTADRAALLAPLTFVEKFRFWRAIAPEAAPNRRKRMRHCRSAIRKQPPPLRHSPKKECRCGGRGWHRGCVATSFAARKAVGIRAIAGGSSWGFGHTIPVYRGRGDLATSQLRKHAPTFYGSLEWAKIVRMLPTFWRQYAPLPGPSRPVHRGGILPFGLQGSFASG